MLKGEDQPSSPVTQTGSATPVVNRFSTPTKQSGSPATGSLTLSTLSAIQTQIPKKSSYLGSEDGSNTTKTQEGARDMSRAISTEPNLRKTPLSPQQNNLKAPIPFDDQLDSPDDILILDDPTGSPVQPVSSPCNSKLNPDAPIFEPMSPVDAWGTLKQETKIAAGGMNKFDECSFLKFASCFLPKAFHFAFHVLQWPHFFKDSPSLIFISLKVVLLAI